VKLNVSLAQVPVYGQVGSNVSVLREAVRRAADEGADILLTPEGALSGYTHLFNRQETLEALAEITALAREHSLGLALGTCMEEEGRIYNQLRFYLPTGEYLGCHTKTLLCGSTEGPLKGEITVFSTLPLRVFDFLGVPIAGLICNDMWANPLCTPDPNPYLCRQLARMGARIIFHAVNGGRDDSAFTQETAKCFHEVNLLMNARADNLVIATVDNAEPEHLGVSSPGGVVTPAGWAVKLPDKGSQQLCHEIDLRAFAEARRSPYGL